MRARKRFTVEPGRAIYFDGHPCIGIERSDEYVAGRSQPQQGMSPYQADQMTRLIARLLNKSKIAKRIASGDWKVADDLGDY